MCMDGYLQSQTGRLKLSRGQLDGQRSFLSPRHAKSEILPANGPTVGWLPPLTPNTRTLNLDSRIRVSAGLFLA